MRTNPLPPPLQKKASIISFSIYSKANRKKWIMADVLLCKPKEEKVTDAVLKLGCKCSVLERKERLPISTGHWT